MEATNSNMTPPNQPLSPAEATMVRLLQAEKTQDEGFRQLMKAYQQRLYWHVKRMVGEHEDANDVLQNTFIRAYRGIGSFNGEAKLYTWLYRIATNEAITFLNKRKNRATLSMDDEEDGNAWDALLTAETPSFTPEEIIERLERAVAVLPDKQRIVFNMRYYDDLSYKDISEILGTSEGALKASFHHAVKKIEAAVTQK